MSQSAAQISDAGVEAPPASVRVWDGFVRIFHWGLVATIAAAFVSAEEWERGHEWIGYAAVVLVAMRIAWGFVGPANARFANFVQRPRVVLVYLDDMRRGREARYLGHNPAGGMMILALVASVVGLGITGYMMTLDAFWGAGWLEDLHEIVANSMLLLIVVHIAGVIVASLRHCENLAASMITGRKRAECRTHSATD